MRGGEASLLDAAADGRADAELLPQVAGGQHDAEFEHAVDLEVGDAGRGLVGDHAIAAIEHAVDAVHQPLEGGAIDLIGTAETMHHPGLAPLCLWVPNALGEGVVGDRRAVAVVSPGGAQIHASLIAELHHSHNDKIARSCA